MYIYQLDDRVNYEFLSWLSLSIRVHIALNRWICQVAVGNSLMYWKHMWFESHRRVFIENKLLVDWNFSIFFRLVHPDMFIEVCPMLLACITIGCWESVSSFLVIFQLQQVNVCLASVVWFFFLYWKPSYSDLLLILMTDDH